MGYLKSDEVQLVIIADICILVSTRGLFLSEI